MRERFYSSRWQLTLTVLFFVGFSIANMLLVHRLVLNDVRDSATVIEAGRLRVLAHEIALESLAVSAGEAARRPHLLVAVSAFDVALGALLEGSPEVGTRPAAGAALARLTPLAGRWSELRADARIVLAEPARSSRLTELVPQMVLSSAVISNQAQELVAQYQDEIRARQQRLWWAVLASGVAAIGVSALAWLLFRWLILIPVERLLAAVKHVTAGDLTARVGPPYSGGELGLLGRTFDEMAVVLEHDIALERRAFDLARSNADLEQFAYIASHDLQEPLRMVSNYTQLLQRRYQGQLDADADEFIGYAVEGARRMKRLINDLLEYSRVTTQGEAPEQTDSGIALNEALGNLRTSLEEQGAEVSVEEMPVVAADPGQLRQLFQNLVANALKFHAADTRPRIEVSASAQEEGLWQFTVSDNGIGIAPQQASRIFDIFQRLHTREEYEGTGIGLAICKRIVERHGGRIWAEPRQPGGTSFNFTLPAYPRLREAA